MSLLYWLFPHLIDVLLSSPCKGARVITAQYKQWVIIDVTAWRVYHGQQQVVVAITQLVRQVQQVEGYVVAL